MSTPEPTPPPSLDQRLIRTSPVLWILGVAFALFLGGLGTQGLSDAADLFPEPSPDIFRQPRVAPLEKRREAEYQTPDPHQAEISRAQASVRDLDRAVTTAEESWRSWLETRATLGKSDAEDKEVRARRDRLDALRKERDDAASHAEKLQREPSPREARLLELAQQISAATVVADEEYAAAHRAWTLKVVAARLVLVAPVWILAAWLWSRRRQSAYVTLLWGYWAFAAWMLLYGIGPYLPHYGGYFPLGIGAAFTVWGSVRLVKWFNARAPLRRQRIVDRAIARHRCPGCDRDYLLGRESALEIGLARKATVRRFDDAALHPRACGSCGLALFGACAACGAVQLVHTERCASCSQAFKPA